MRWALRFALSTSVLAILLLVLLKNHLEDLWDQYDVTAYIGASWKNTFKHGTVENITNFNGQHGDKVIIMAKLEKENTDWVAEGLPDWQAAIYTVNPTHNLTTGLTTPMNKGHEAMAYLSYMIDNYSSLPSTLSFLHSHRSGFLSAWHTDAPLHDNVAALRTLQLPFVQKNGYVNLRCHWNPGCEVAHRDNAHVSPEVWEDVFAGTSTEAVKGKVPIKVGAACCAQFAVSRDQVLRRPLRDYQRLREWIVETEKSDAQSGRAMEFLWHVIFGKDAVYCPPEQQCYCDVYGRCQ